MNANYFTLIIKFVYNFWELYFHYIVKSTKIGMYFVAKKNKDIFASILKLHLEDILNGKFNKNQLNQIKITTNSFSLFDQCNLIRKKFVNRINDYADLYGEITYVRRVTKRADRKRSNSSYRNI